MTGLVRWETAGQLATITLDSPANRNALSTALLTQLHDALAGALTDPAVRVIVLTGSGPVFCAGADLKESRQHPAAAAALFPQILQLIWDSDKPVICRANGTARAGGIGLIAACDIAIAPESATFAFTEVRIGAAAAIIAVTCLRRMEPRAAHEYFLTGRDLRRRPGRPDRAADPRRAGRRPRRRGQQVREPAAARRAGCDWPPPRPSCGTCPDCRWPRGWPGWPSCPRAGSLRRRRGRGWPPSRRNASPAGSCRP